VSAIHYIPRPSDQRGESSSCYPAASAMDTPVSPEEESKPKASSGNVCDALVAAPRGVLCGQKAAVTVQSFPPAIVPFAN